MLTIILIWCRHALSISVLLSLLCVCVCISKSRRRSSFCQSLLSRVFPSHQLSLIKRSRLKRLLSHRLDQFARPKSSRHVYSSHRSVFHEQFLVSLRLSVDGDHFAVFQGHVHALVAFDQAASDDDIVPTFDDDDRDFSHQRLHVTQQRALPDRWKKRVLSFLFGHLFFSPGCFVEYYIGARCARVFSVVHFGATKERAL